MSVSAALQFSRSAGRQPLSSSVSGSKTCTRSGLQFGSASLPSPHRGAARSPPGHSEIAISRPFLPTVSTSMPPGTFDTAPAMYWHVMMRPIALYDRPSSRPMSGSSR